VRGDELGERARFEDRLAREQLEGDAAERIDVRPMVQILGALALLGRDVRQACRAARRRRDGGHLAGAHELGDAEVQDLDRRDVDGAALAAEEDVVRLEVAVDDPRACAAASAVATWRTMARARLTSTRASRTARVGAQRLAGEKLHDDVRLGIWQRAAVEDLDDAGCLMRAVARASLKKRVTASAFADMAGSSSLMAACRR